MARFKTKMTEEKYMGDDWPSGKTDWLALESDIRAVLRDHFAHDWRDYYLDHIDRLLEYYTGRGSENIDETED